MDKAAIGFRAKTGRAIAVVLSGDAKVPRFVWRGEISLMDPAVPAVTGPYHEVMELPWSEATVAVQPLVRSIEAATNDVVRRLIADMRERDVDVRYAGVVGSAAKNLERIGNYHIRAHAAEGMLFRRVLEVAAAKSRLRCIAYSENELKEESDDEMLATVKLLGRQAGPPWRADERSAATVAWIALRKS